MSPVPLQVVHQDFVQESLDDQVVLSCSRHAVSLTCHNDLARACSRSLSPDCVPRAIDGRSRGRTRVRGASIAFTRCIQTPYLLANVPETLNLVDGRLPPDSCFPVMFGGFVVEGLEVADCLGSYTQMQSSPNQSVRAQ